MYPAVRSGTQRDAEVHRGTQWYAVVHRGTQWYAVVHSAGVSIGVYGYPAIGRATHSYAGVLSGTKEGRDTEGDTRVLRGRKVYPEESRRTQTRLTYPAVRRGNRVFLMFHYSR